MPIQRRKGPGARGTGSKQTRPYTPFILLARKITNKEITSKEKQRVPLAAFHPVEDLGGVLGVLGPAHHNLARK